MFFDDEEIDFSKISFIYELRHSCNLYGVEYVASKLRILEDRIVLIYESLIHGSVNFRKFIYKDEEKFRRMFDNLNNEAFKREDEKLRAKKKNETLVESLEDKRKNFAGIGTNKAKRRLNKLGKENAIAFAVRKALEIEDVNIQAKKYYGEYKDKIYEKKHRLILELVEVFKVNGWIFGVHNCNEVFETNYVIYFEIPGCEQISWHINLNKCSFPIYEKEWDGLQNSTLCKLENIFLKLLKNNNLL